LFEWPAGGGGAKYDKNIVREVRELTYLTTTKAWVLGEWEAKKEGVSENDIEGRVIHINKDHHSLYVGFMHDGKRNGWGVELPLKNLNYRKDLKYAGTWTDNKIDMIPDSVGQTYRTRYIENANKYFA